MRKISKRILSTFLAAVLVFTTVPFTALTAFAKKTPEPTSYAYLTNGVDSAFGSSSGVTWNSTEQAAYFDGSHYLELSNFGAFANVSSTTGFMISFDFKKTSSNGEWGFVFSLTKNDSNTNRFTFNAGSNTANEWNRGLTFAVVNNAYNSYYSNDLANSDHCSTTGTQWKPDNDTWYNVTLYMKPTGGFTYYLNGTDIGTFRSDYSKSSNGANDNSVVANAIKDFNKLYIGRGAENEGYLNGYVKNLQFLVPDNSNDLDEALKTAMDAYEAKMADRKLYKNLSAAYTKYQQASARYDAYIYGEANIADNSSYYRNAAFDLVTTTGAMQPWEATFNASAYHEGNPADNADGTYGYSNVAYASTTTGWNNSFQDRFYTYFKVALPSNIVLVYDGLVTPSLPAVFEHYKNGNHNQNIKAVACTTTNLDFTKNWVGYTDKNTTNVTGQTGTGYQVWPGSVVYNASGHYNDLIGYDSDHQLEANATNNTNRYYWNQLYYTGSGNTSSYYETFSNPSFWIRGYGGSNQTKDWNAENTTTYVINYKPILDNIPTYRTALNNAFSNKTVADYKEGGLTSLFTAADRFTSDSSNPSKYSYSNVASDVSSCAASIKAAIDNNSYTAPVPDSNYTELRAAIDYSGTIASGDSTSVLAEIAKKTATSTTDGENNGGYIKGLYKTFALKYYAAVEAMEALKDKSTYPTGSVAATASDLTSAFTALNVADITKPTVTPVSGRLLSPTDTITINNTEASRNRGGQTAYTVSFSDSSAALTNTISGSTASATLTPFSGKTTPGLTATVTATASATLSGDLYSTISDTYTYTLYTPPVIDDLELDYNEGVTITSTNGSDAGTIQYSLDNSYWNDYNPSSKYAPFTSATASTVNFYVRETKTLTDSESNEYTVTSESKRYLLERNADFDIKAKYSDGSVNSKGASYYDENSTIWIENAGTYSADITYTLYIDGVLDKSYTYEKANGIALTDAIKSASFIKIIAFATDRATGSTQQTEKTLFNAAKFDPLIYRESFDGATVSGGVSLTTGTNDKTKGVNLAVVNEGDTIALQTGAGTKSSSTESYSWRNNVLKINANSTTPGPVVKAASNPLSSEINAAAAKSEGVTISFWRHLEDSSGNTVSLPSSGDSTGYPWRNAIAFQEHDNNSTYYIIEVNGVSSRRIDGSNFTDVVPENQDGTLHEEGNNNGEWEHVAITINPTGGMHVYTNGVEHDYKYTKVTTDGTEVTTDNIASQNIANTTVASAAEILNFITDSTTDFTFDNGVLYEGNPYNLFLDDIRIYAQTLTQTEINNMYVDEYADVQTNVTSTSHDPTTVTVYTLKEDVEGMEAGDKVGVEFIEYYNVPMSKIAAVDYYSFGTGMTIYKATGEDYSTVTGDSQIKWEVLGDSEGRCGYQNQDLFGGVYYEQLTEAVNWVDSDGNHTQGAGRLVWAPHVMYNLTLDKWVYYAAMSSWGSTRSVTFMCTSDDPIKNYTFDSIVYKSNSNHPNAIDICVFYGYDSNGKPNKNNLYMVIGSWGQSHSSTETVYNASGEQVTQGRYGAIFGAQLNANGKAKAAVSGTADSLESAGSTENGGDTSKGVELARGYMPDVEGGGESGGSGEGAYVQYIDGYYYLFVSYGQNEGSYTERVFRSTNPLGPYTASNGVTATNPNANDHRIRGNQILSPFDISIYTKIYRSTGHSSVFKAQNADGDWVYINAAHARPYASASHNWVGVQDNALAKRQSGNVTGNVSLNNMLAVTEHKWLVMFPYQFNRSDTIYKQVTADQLEGLYKGNNLRQSVNSNWGLEYQFTVLANSGDETNTTGVIYGVRGDDSEFLMKFKLVRDANGDRVQYIRMYDNSVTYDQILADNATPIHEGVIGLHTKNGSTIPMFATLDINPSSSTQGLQFWSYRAADVPDVDRVISHGDLVAMDDVIYTHASDQQIIALANVKRADYYNSSTDTYDEAAFKAAQKNALKNAANYRESDVNSDRMKSFRNSSYAVYGNEISDNYQYGVKDSNGYYATGGEKFTTIATKYPSYIEIDPATGYSKTGSIISLNDTEYCRDYGETGSNMHAVPTPMSVSGVDKTGWWCTKNGATYTPAYATDEEAAAAVAADSTLALYKVYYIKGTVSTFFRYYDNEDDGVGVTRNGYPKIGVTLVVAYKDAETGHDYSEFEFCYVMPNPAWAHTLAATRNTHQDNVIGATTNDYNSSYAIFNRFLESNGDVTAYSSSMLRYASMGNVDDTSGWGTGVSANVTDFSLLQNTDSSNTATYKELDSLDKIKTLFNFYDDSVGNSSGSFAAWTHDDAGSNAYTATPELINVSYYIDYSDKDNYLVNNPNTGLITTSSNNTTEVPTGYQFKMRTSNFLWYNYSKSSIFDVTSYAKNTTGLNINYTSTYDGKTNIDGKYDGSQSNLIGPDVSGASGNYSDTGLYSTNYDYFGTDVTFGGKKRWYADSMLFFNDMRTGKYLGTTHYSKSAYNIDYRNKLLYYFSNGNKVTLTGDDKYESEYVDGNKYSNGTTTQVYDYSGNKAYSTAANGKGNTNTWQGLAVFTGKNRVHQNTVDDLKAIGDASSSDTLSFSNGRLYDGYWYKYTQNDREYEGWANSIPSGANSGGQLDVTTENLANYILEMGNYHKISDVSLGGGRLVGNETYHYYNIGVATCDKGAARDFIETYALKRLQKDANGKVRLDANGRPLIDTTADENHPGDTSGDIYVENISAASFRDYIDALSKLEWFVHNPQNTLQSDLKTAVAYKDMDVIKNASDDEYTTAYSSGDAVYIVKDTEETDIFGTGTTKTDPVQAQLIADVIEAYEHLYTVDDYKEVEREYKAIKEELEAEKVTGNYTTESVSDYVDAFEALKRAVEYKTVETGIDTDVDATLLDFDDEDYWRYSEYSGADYDAIREAMKEIQKSLMPKVNETALQTTADTQATVVQQGIYEGGVQKKSFGDWAALYDEVLTADGEKFSQRGVGIIQNEAAEARYETTKTVTLNELLDLPSGDEDVSYKVYRTTLPSGVTAHDATYYDSENADGDVYVSVAENEYAKISDSQKTVNAENHTLSHMDIADVDIDSAYQSYDAAYTVVNAVDRDKYLPIGVTELENAIATRSQVYTEATATLVNKYKNALSLDAAPFSAGDELKSTAKGKTDPITTTLLTTASVLESDANKAQYVKLFKVDFTVVKDGETVDELCDTDNVYYGEATKEFELGEGAYNSSFSVQNYSGYYYYDGGNLVASTAPSPSTPSGASKFTFAGDKFSKVAKNNMAITCTINPTVSGSDGQRKIEIRDIYGAIVEILYTSNVDSLPASGVTTLTIDGSTISPRNVAFYTFSSWKRMDYNDSTSGDRITAYIPLYNAGDMVDISVESGATVTGASAKSGSETEYETAFDTLVTLDASEVSGFYAWATVDSVENRYQIASYNPTYSFYAIAPENFVIIKYTTSAGVNTYYEPNGSTELKAAKVDTVFSATSEGLTADQMLKLKLDSKAPFVSLIAANLSNNNKSANVYCRITAGATTKPSVVGTLGTSKSADKAYMVKGTATLFKTSTVSDVTGQYTYTISRSSSAFTAVTFRAYISYNLTYTFNGSSYDLNLDETSENILVATPTA